MCDSWNSFARRGGFRGDLRFFCGGGGDLRAGVFFGLRDAERERGDVTCCFVRCFGWCEWQRKTPRGKISMAIKVVVVHKHHGIMRKRNERSTDC